MDIVAKPTTYHSVTFRSRLEARWAVFFDHLGLAWRYEPRNYEIGSGDDTDWYQPDFWLPGVNAFFEVKPVWPTEREMWKTEQLAHLTKKRVVLAYGMPYSTGVGGDGFDYRGRALDMDEVGAMAWEISGDAEHPVYWDYPYRFCICTMCGGVGIEFDARSGRTSDRHGHFSGDEKDYTGDHPRIQSAYGRAQTFRFDIDRWKNYRMSNEEKIAMLLRRRIQS